MRCASDLYVLWGGWLPEVYRHCSIAFLEGAEIHQKIVSIFAQHG